MTVRIYNWTRREWSAGGYPADSTLDFVHVVEPLWGSEDIIVRVDMAETDSPVFTLLSGQDDDYEIMTRLKPGTDLHCFKLVHRGRGLVAPTDRGLVAPTDTLRG